MPARASILTALSAAVVLAGVASTAIAADPTKGPAPATGPYRAVPGAPATPFGPSRSVSTPGFSTGSAGRPLPDLTIAANSVALAPLALGQSFKICPTVTNIGQAESGPFQLSAGAVGSSPAPVATIANLSAGASQQQCLHYAAAPMTAGTVTVQVKADALNAVAESNENNNTLSVAVTTVAPPQPDLVITGTVLQPQTLTPGQSFQVCPTVKNIGTLASGASQVVGSPLGGTAPSQVVGALAVGASSQACLNYPTAPASGVTFLTLTADGLNAVTESNETNNTATFGITVTATAAKPDLTIGATSQQPMPATPGQPFQMCLTIQNTGGGAAGGFRVSGGGLGSGTAPFQDVGGLGAGASSQVCLSYSAAPASSGTWLGYNVDSLSSVTESNETNNSVSLPVIVATPSLPDFIISSWWFEDPVSQAHITSVVAGHGYLACYVVKNQGPGNAGGFSVTGSLPGGNIQTQNFNGLPSGGSYSSCFNGAPAVATNGGLSVGWIADANNQVAETNETNNSAFTYLQVN